MSTNNHPENGSPKSPSVNFPEPASAEKCAPDLFACAKEPPPIKTQKIDLDELLGGIKENKKPEKKTSLDKLIEEVKEGIAANVRAYEKSQAQSFQGPMAPPAAQSENLQKQDESVRKAPYGNIEKAEPPVSLGNISSSSVNLIKGTVDKHKQSLLMKLRSGMEKLLPHMMNPKTSSSVFKKILADKFLDNYALSEFYNSSMLGDDCTSAKPMKRIEETNRLKSHCDDQMIKMIAAIKSLEDAPAGTSVKIKANQVNLSSTQQVNNNKEAPKDPGESAALKREDKNQKK